MKKVFQIEKCSKIEYKFLWDLYLFTRANSHIHNLSTIKKIPFSIECLLNLGMKFCLSTKPDLAEIRNCTKETLRKFAWRIYFKLHNEKQVDDDNNLKNWFISCTKDFRNINNLNGPICSLQSMLCNANLLSNIISNKVANSCA